MTLTSWNVNGLRACLKKGLGEWLAEHQPDVLCLQETKARPQQVTLPPEFDGYRASWNPAEKPGYSGVATFSREEPLAVEFGLGIDEHDREGRMITSEFADFHLVNVYTPNAQDKLRRLPYRQTWDRAFRAHLTKLRESGKAVIFCGDLNVAHREIDIARPDQNRHSAGFSDEERTGFSELLESGFIDTFRHLYPDQTAAYTWWSYRGGARARNVGWRLDYFGISDDAIDRVVDSSILAEIPGSDHCPVSLDFR